MTAHLYGHMWQIEYAHRIFPNFKRDNIYLIVVYWRQQTIYWLCPPNSDKRRLGNGTGLVSPLWYNQKCGLRRTQPHSNQSSVNSYSGEWWCRGYPLLTCSWTCSTMLALAGLVFWSTETIWNGNICWSMTLSLLVLIPLLLCTQLWVCALVCGI